jgi:hypothetical protein
MLQWFSKLLSREPQLTLNHSYFGRLLFIRGTNAASNYWEGELAVLGLPEKVGLTIPAPESGPSEAQVHFCRSLLGDLEALFTRCKPVFEGKFEEWTQKAFPSHWREDFSLVGLGLPVGGDEMRPWDVTYFVEAANHYFTASFENGTATHLTIDG